MATKLTAWLVSDRYGIGGSSCCCNYNNGKHTDVRFLLLTSRRFLPVSCKMRNRDLSYQQKRQGVKKASPEHSPSNPDCQSSGDEDSDTEHYTVSVFRNKIAPNEFVDTGNNAKVLHHTDAEELDSQRVMEQIHPSAKFQSGVSKNSEIESHCDLNLRPEIINTELVDSGKDIEHHHLANADDLESSPGIVKSSVEVDREHHMMAGDLGSGRRTEQVHNVDDCHLNTSIICGKTSSALFNIAGEGLSTMQLEDLTGMIRNAENNILLLNEARVRALQELERSLSEKETLQGELNTLQIKMAETDAKMKLAAQQKIHVELLQSHVDKLRVELNHRGATERALPDVHKNRNQLPDNDSSLAQNNSLHFLNEELSFLRKENVSLKKDIEALKAELSNAKSTGERVITLEKERCSLESCLRDLESKLSASQEDISKLSSLKVECKNLWEKVENLQALLDKATKQADQAIIVLQQNQELQKKVDKLEESLEEANACKLTSEKLQEYNELMQQKIELLEERLQKSDEEIHSYIQLYQESAQEFQDTLNSLKEESKKRALDEPAEMPQEFWSRLLLIIDGWLLEKKISTRDAMLLREMVWKRERQICDTFIESREKSEHEVISMFLKLTSSPKGAGFYVVHIAAEMAPVAKVGGLGDVVTGLGKALQKRGHLVEIVLPKYDCMQYDRIQNLRALDMVLESYFDGKLHKNKIWTGSIEGLPVYFIEPHHQDKFFWRGQFYGEHDDFRRFSFFSRAALELLLQAGKRPDIIHCHDWQTAFVAPLYWDIYVPKGLNAARICFTCHNFEYQGTAPASELASCGLDIHQLNRPDRMQDNSAHDRINPVKGAVVFSNVVTTVSPTYAQEVQTAEGGRGLHSTLNFHSRKFVGILNGIDTDAWNPATDTFLDVQYSANDLEGKTENKIAIRKHLKLSNADVGQPMVGCITRLVPQKGVHLIRHAIYRTLELGGQFVLLGSSPVAHIQREFEDIANKFKDHDHIQLILKYDESLSHSIFAASDMFIIPSIFEPCGLTQMIAMRYGSIPIARKTGGLNDSVFDIDDDSAPFQFRNGFTFLTPDEHGVNSALERAFSYYRNNPEGWNQLVKKDMNLDFSWQISATQYEELYAKTVARARALAASRE